MKDTWRIVGQIINKSPKCSFPALFSSCTGDVSDPKDISNEFNKYFSTVGSTLANQIGNTHVSIFDSLPPSTSQSAFFENTDREEVLKIIKSLKDTSSVGVDGIPTSVIKLSSEVICSPIASLFNNFLANGCFPNLLKVGKVIPVYKGGERNIFSNYRPISLLTNFSKIFEKLIYVRLKSFMAKQNIPSSNQYGFQSHKSTSMAVLEMVDIITDAMDSKSCAMGLFIDLAKAFDTVDHVILMKKLSHYGIRGEPLDLLQDYMNGRKQYVSCSGVNSSVRDICYGVPQGSILGPLLFLIYVNDMTHCSHILEFILFADDTNIFLTNRDANRLYDTINVELVALSHWFKANKLSLNISKTNYMLFTNSSKFKQLCALQNVKIDGEIITRVDKCKFLGVIIDDKISWKPHILSVTSTVARNLGVMRRVRSKIDSKTTLLLYDTMIVPHFSYCNLIWANCAKSYLIKLYRLQKRAIRLVFMANKLFHAAPLFRKLLRLNVYDLYHFQLASFVYINNN